MNSYESITHLFYFFIFIILLLFISNFPQRDDPIPQTTQTIEDPLAVINKMQKHWYSLPYLEAHILLKAPSIFFRIDGYIYNQFLQTSTRVIHSFFIQGRFFAPNQSRQHLKHCLEWLPYEKGGLKKKTLEAKIYHRPKKTNTIYQLQLQRQREVITVLMFVSITLLITTFLYHRNYAAQLKANRELKLINLKLHQYSNSIAHDIASKLKSIMCSGTSLIEEESCADIEAYKEYYNESRSCTKWLLKYNSDLYSWSRRNFDPASVKTPLQPVLQNILASFERVLQNANFKVILEGTESAQLPIEAEPLGQLMYNLLDNAIKSSRNEITPSLKVSFDRKGVQHFLTIEDNGIGLPKELLGKLNGTIRSYNGSRSKGMTIIENIVSQNKGILIGSASQLGGAKFSMQFIARNKLSIK